MEVRDSCVRMYVGRHLIVVNTSVRRYAMRVPANLVRKFHLESNIAHADEKR